MDALLRARASDEVTFSFPDRIQQRAYVLFQACGCEHGHDLEHWLEAERQITGLLDHSDR